MTSEQALAGMQERPMPDGLLVDMGTRESHIFTEPGFINAANEWTVVGSPRTEIRGFMVGNTTRGYASQDGINFSTSMLSDILVVADGHGGTDARDVALREIPHYFIGGIYHPDLTAAEAGTYMQHHTQERLKLERGLDMPGDGTAYAAVRFKPVEGTNKTELTTIVPADCEAWVIRKQSEVSPLVRAKDLDDPLVAAAAIESGAQLVRRPGHPVRAVGENGVGIAVANVIGDELVPGISGRPLTSEDMKTTVIDNDDIVMMWSDGLKHMINTYNGNMRVIYELVANADNIVRAFSLGGKPELLTMFDNFYKDDWVKIDLNGVLQHIGMLPIGSQEKRTITGLVQRRLQQKQTALYHDGLALATELIKGYLDQISGGRYVDDVTFVVAKPNGMRTEESPAVLERLERFQRLFDGEK